MQAGELFGKYALVKCLGSGGSAEVWQGWDPELKRHVAIKFLLSTQEEHGQRLLREAELVSKLEHPGIVPIYEAGTSGRTPYVVMKFIEGPTLLDAKLTLEEKVSAVRDAARALDYAHRNGIIHRDVKPDNILVELPGPKVYVADFGLAKQHEVDTSVSVSGAVIGTAQYMAPEQAEGHARRADARSDVYSLGATLYELTTGRPPFDGPSFVSVVMSVVNDEPPSPRGLNPTLPRDLNTIILKAIEKDPDRRYATAEEFANDLQRYLDGDPIRARRSSVVYRLVRIVRKHRWVSASLAVTALIVLAFSATVVVSKLSRDREKAQALSDARNAEQHGRWEEAMAAYERASTLDPGDAEVARKKDGSARRVEIEKQKLEDSAKSAVLQKEANEIYLQAEREMHLLRTRSYRADWRLTEEEFAEYRRLIERCQAQMKKSGPAADGWWIIGRANDVLGDPSLAMEAYDAGLKSEPDHTWCLLYKARLLIEQAIVHRFRRSNDRGQPARTDQWVREGVALIERATTRRGVGEIEIDLAKGYALVVKGEPTHVYCEEMLKKWAGKDFREEFFLIRGLAHREVLIEDATEALKARPGFYDALFWRGVQRRHQGDREGEIADYTQAIAINPRNWLALEHRAIALKHKKEYAASLKDYDLSIAIYPSRVAFYVGRGDLRRLMGDKKGALADFETAIKMDPQDPDGYANRGLLRTEKKDVDGAMEDLNHALELCPTLAEALINRGVLKFNLLRDYPGAVEDATRALQIAPDNPLAYQNRAIAYKELKKLDEAIRDMDKAIELNPDNAMAYCTRATIHSAKGSLDQAIEDNTKALELNPKLYDALWNRGSVWYDKANRHPPNERECVEAALADLENAVKIGPKSWQTDPAHQQGLDLCRRRLKKLQGDQ